MKRLFNAARLAAVVCFIFVLVQAGAAGIAYAQCAGGSTSVECTGVDPDGYFTLPGNSTTVTVHGGAQVNGPIFLDGNDTLNVQPGGAINDGLIGGPAVFSTNGSQVNNAGTIHSEGELANLGIAGVDSGPITNSGTISANGIDQGTGIETNGVDTLITNSGTIEASGGSMAEGIYATGTNTARVNNSGSITTDGSGASVGLIAQGGATAQVANSGTIETSGGFAATSMQVVGGDMAQVTNSGLVRANGVMIGMGFLVAGNNAQVTNSGTVDAGGGMVAMGMQVIAGNTAQVTNSGTINAHGSDMGVGLVVQGVNSQVNNSGTINVSGGVQGMGLMVQGNAEITNSGAISGSTDAIWATAGGQTVTNSGTINGGVWLEDSNDSFNAAGGVVNGLIDGGDGYDVLRFTMDISAESWESALAALAGQLDPNGGTVVLGGVTYTWSNFEELVHLIRLYAIRDRRINGLDIAATAIVYRLEETGVELYTPQGEWAFRSTADAIHAALAQAKSSGSPVEVQARLGLALYALPDGSLFATGPGYAFAFQPYQCGIDG